MIKAYFVKLTKRGTVGHKKNAPLFVHKISIRVGNSLFDFLCALLVFGERKSERVICSCMYKSESLFSLFLKEQQEQIALITVFKRVTRAIASFTKSEKSHEEQFALWFWALKGLKHGETNKFEVKHS